jgi:hypothetical protein
MREIAWGTGMQLDARAGVSVVAQRPNATDPASATPTAADT